MSEPHHMSAVEMRGLLREAYGADPEKSFLGQFTRRLCDPAMPRDRNNRPRVHPLWLSLALVLVFVLGVFAYFNLLRT